MQQIINEVTSKLWDSVMRNDYHTARVCELKLFDIMKAYILNGDFKAAFTLARQIENLQGLNFQVVNE